MFSKFSIERPIFASVISILIVIAGGVTLATLPTVQYPEINPSTVGRMRYLRHSRMFLLTVLEYHQPFPQEGTFLMIMIQYQDPYDYFLREVWYDKTDVQADGLAAMHISCPDSMQRKT